MAHQQQTDQTYYSNNNEQKQFLEKVTIYLKLISEATRMLSQNMGSYRKDIWDYMLRIYGTPECDTLEYRDFLHAIRRLIQEGKLLNEQGLFRVETNTYREIWDVKPEAMV